MSISRKFGRTYHYDFSPGTTSDDRINKNWFKDISKMARTIDTEKLDGENTCMNGIGLFARSHAAPTRHPWSNHLKSKYSLIKQDLKDTNIEIFGENLYAIHSIIYPNIKEHFYVFGIRCLDKWLSWDEVKWYSEFFEYPVVPELSIDIVNLTNEMEIKQRVISESEKPSMFGSHQSIGLSLMGEPCSKEGIVTRNYNEFDVRTQSENIFKYVRKGHVSTDTHWSKNWKRARLIHEY